LCLGPFLHNDTKAQYSAISCAFSDFPLSSNDAMSKLGAQKYLLDYAKAFSLDTKVKLNTEVVDIRRHETYDESGKWTLKYKQYVVNNTLHISEFQERKQ
jgi:cation diffusion facilitator CzcD-associated flavoprotein CzcO